MPALVFAMQPTTNIGDRPDSRFGHGVGICRGLPAAPFSVGLALQQTAWSLRLEMSGRALPKVLLPPLARELRWSPKSMLVRRETFLAYKDQVNEDLLAFIRR